uniref:Uncharacterized protein n=1 Tax=Arundo donax TaxID=35708 RepID=A0A0A9AF09_ARUDO
MQIGFEAGGRRVDNHYIEGDCNELSWIVKLVSGACSKLRK